MGPLVPANAGTHPAGSRRLGAARTPLRCGKPAPSGGSRGSARGEWLGHGEEQRWSAGGYGRGDDAGVPRRRGGGGRGGGRGGRRSGASGAGAAGAGANGAARGPHKGPAASSADGSAGAAAAEGEAEDSGGGADDEPPGERVHSEPAGPNGDVGDLAVVASTMGGQSFEVQVARESRVAELSMQLCKAVEAQPWQLRLILADATLLEDPARPLAELAPADNSPLQLTTVVSRGVPDHVHANSVRLFGLLQSKEASQALALLREGRVNVNARSDVKHVSKGRKFGGASLLQVAAEELAGPELLSVARLMLEMGAKPSFADANGMQPLHVACEGGKGCLAQLLLEHRADIRALFTGKQTPLHLALGYFADCEVGKRSEEEVALGEACCSMVASTAHELNGKRLTPLAMARKALAEAVGLVLGCERHRLSQRRPITRDEVFQFCTVPKSLLQAFGAELWEGWPKDFMPEPNAFIEKCFAD
uniref:Ubiquitin-like domain-containing protein n=1 Tax=Alexandrium monilatum TaxID=311494 RepID=A0A7S4UJ67_9DINO